MPEFFYKRIVHVAEYYRITAPDEGTAYSTLNERLDALTDGLTMYQEVCFPASHVVSLERHEDIEEVESVPEDDADDQMPPSPEEEALNQTLLDAGYRVAEGFL